MMGPSSSRQPWRSLSDEGYDVLREARIELVIADKRINCAERRMHASRDRRGASSSYRTRAVIRGAALVVTGWCLPWKPTKRLIQST